MNRLVSVGLVSLFGSALCGLGASAAYAVGLVDLAPQSQAQVLWRLSQVDKKPACLATMSDLSFELRSDFHLPNAVLMLLYGHLDGNWEEPRIRQQLINIGFQRIHFFSKQSEGMTGFIAVHPDFVHIHFRGTYDLFGALTDAKFVTKDAEPLGLSGKVHAGFFSGALTAAKAIDAALSGERKDKPILLSGHSYGAALASLSGARLAKQGFQVSSVYSSAQPRVGDNVLVKDIVDTLSDRYHRISYNEDIVPHVPPVPDAAEDFAFSFPKIGDLNKKLGRWAYTLGYSHQAPVWEISETETLHLHTNDVQHDVEYWREQRRALNENPVQTPAWIAKKYTDHYPESYLCQFAKPYLNIE